MCGFRKRVVAFQPDWSLSEQSAWAAASGARSDDFSRNPRVEKYFRILFGNVDTV
jgi:hypothetical protein